VFFSHPISKNWIYWAKYWWDSSILDNTTYIKIKHLIQQHFSHILNESNIIYLIQTDINNKSKKESWIRKYINKYCPAWEIHISFASLMIENWFIAWMWSTICTMNQIDIKIIKKLLKKDIDSYPNAKQKLDDLLPTHISWSRHIIWREFWKYLDIQQARDNSPSFNVFIECIESIFWEFKPH